MGKGIACYTITTLYFVVEILLLVLLILVIFLKFFYAETQGNLKNSTHQELRMHGYIPIMLILRDTIYKLRSITKKYLKNLDIFSVFGSQFFHKDARQRWESLNIYEISQAFL